MILGILSMQQVNNYGSYWQAYSLKKILEDLGHDIYFIDILPGRQIVDTTYKKQFSLSKIKRIPYYYYSRQRKAIFKKFQKNSFNHCEETLDGILIGSDEVFNCKQDSPWGFTTQLFGDMECDLIITYAASFGYTNYSFILDKGIESEISNSMMNIKALSVRDSNSRYIVQQITGRNSEVHLDPVLINMDVDDYSSNARVPKQKYIFVYSYDFRLNEKPIIDKIYNFAHENNLIVVAGGFYQDWVDKNILCSPTEILGLFKNAEYVVTDTFHGTIFSIKYHKKFATIVRSSNKEKLGDLLTRLCLVDQMLEHCDDFELIMNQQPSYGEIDKILEAEREKSINYLKKALEY